MSLENQGKPADQAAWQEFYRRRFENQKSWCVDDIESFLKELLQHLVPERRAQLPSESNFLKEHVELRARAERLVSCHIGSESTHAQHIVGEVFAQLIAVEEMLARDAEFIVSGDPAAHSLEEVRACYPGFLAIAVHRISHLFFLKGVPLLPRILSEWAHRQTGVDIHPGAKIGCPFFIDHGTGIVIGESAVIGNRVKIYQGVTLGALSVKKELQKQKRHPTIQDDCILYSNATVLGGDTIVGHGSVLGGNTWTTASLAPGSRVFVQSPS